MSGEIVELFELHNQARVRRQLSRLRLDDRLLTAAHKHAVWMAENRKLIHTGEGGSSVSERVRREGYTARTVGENIAAGQRTVQEVFNAWMGSPGHRSNILNSEFAAMGLGVADMEYGGRLVRFWCCVFGSGFTVLSDTDAITEETPGGLPTTEAIIIIQEIERSDGRR